MPAVAKSSTYDRIFVADVTVQPWTAAGVKAPGVLPWDGLEQVQRPSGGTEVETPTCCAWTLPLLRILTAAAALSPASGSEL